MARRPKSEILHVRFSKDDIERLRLVAEVDLTRPSTWVWQAAIRALEAWEERRAAAVDRPPQRLTARR